MRISIMIAIIVGVVFSTFGYADEKPTGIYGYVYNHNGVKAGTQLDTIYIIRLDESGNASYYYNSGTSYWVTNDVYGLEDGHWGIYGVTNENGTPYYSPCYTHWYEFGDWINQDINCTKASPPSIPYDP